MFAIRHFPKAPYTQLGWDRLHYDVFVHRFVKLYYDNEIFEHKEPK